MLEWYISGFIFTSVFLLTLLLIYRRMRHLRDSWLKVEILSLFGVATVLAIALTFSFLLGSYILILWFETELENKSKFCIYFVILCQLDFVYTSVHASVLELYPIDICALVIFLPIL